jgi:hypothetical protein
MEILSNIKLLWLSLSNALKLDEHESQSIQMKFIPINLPMIHQISKLA